MANRTYEILHSNGMKRSISIPEEWKVTYGPCVPGALSNGPFGKKQMPFALRVYESKEKQRAIFTDVVSFMDTSIPMSIDMSEMQTQTNRHNGGSRPQPITALGAGTRAPMMFNEIR